MRFVANLRQETINAFSSEAIQPAAYLLSSHRISAAALRIAATIRGFGLPLYADNGTKPLIDQTVALFKDRADAIRQQVRVLRKQIGRAPRKADVPAALRSKAVKLADEVIDHVTQTSDAIDLPALLEAQLSMRPTHLIAKEDFASACLMALDLEREVTGWTLDRWETRNRRSLKSWQIISEDPRCKRIKVFAVLSAVDYDTARMAGRLAAERGVLNVALGIAGITLDPSATDHFVMSRRTIELKTAAPRRFVRLAQILRGLADGYAERGVSLKNFHCLGLGAPAMMPIAAAALSEGTAVTADATSPIHDAVRDRVLYELRRQGDRAGLIEIVDRIVGGESWPLESPFLKAFGRKYGNRVGQAREAWKALGKPKITSELLRKTNGISTALPLFSTADPAVTSIASKTHIAHNHWVLDLLCAGFPDKRGRRTLALDALRKWIAERTSSTTTRGLAAALQAIEADL